MRSVPEGLLTKGYADAVDLGLGHHSKDYGSYVDGDNEAVVDEVEEPEFRFLVLHFQVLLDEVGADYRSNLRLKDHYDKQHDEIHE